MRYLELGFTYFGTPYRYCLWVLAGIGIDPVVGFYANGLLYLYVLALFDFRTQMPGVYGGFAEFNKFAQLAKFGFYFGAENNPNLILDHVLQPSIALLCYFASVVAYNQFLMRLLLNFQHVFPSPLLRILTHIFNNRLLTYTIAYTSLFPVSLLYTMSLFEKQSSQLAALSVASIHTILFIVVNIMIIYMSRRVFRTKSYVKLVYLMAMIEGLAIVQGLAIVGERGQMGNKGMGMFSGVEVLGIAVLVFFGFGGWDWQPETASLYFGQRNKNQDEEEEEEEDDREEEVQSRKLVDVRHTIRKVNLVFQFLFFTAICAIRYVYVQSDFLGVENQHQLFGTIITVLILIGNLSFGLILSIICTLLSIVIFIKTPVPLPKQPNRQSPTKRKLQEDQSNNHLTIQNQ